MKARMLKLEKFAHIIPYAVYTHPIHHWCPTFSSTGPHLLNGISLWAATNNSNYNGVQYRLEFFNEYILT